jgi:hypothetical protein
MRGKRLLKVSEINLCRVRSRASRCGSASARAHAGLPLPPLARLLTPRSCSFTRADFLSLTESRKQAQAEIEYYKLYEPEKLEQLEQRHDSKVDPLQLDDTASNPVEYSANCTPRSASPVKDPSTLIARTVVRRRGSDDSVKTAYAADEEVPDSAYRDHSAPRSGI